MASAGLARGLLRAGAEVALVLPRAPGDVRMAGLTLFDASAPAWTAPGLAPSLEREGVPATPLPSAYESVPASRRGPRARHRPALRAAPAAYGPDLVTEVLRYAEAAGRIARAERFDVIHAHDWLTYLAGLEARRISGRPLVVHVHATELDRAGGLENRFVTDIESLGVRLADRVIAVSRYTADRVAEIYGVARDRIRVVHNAIDAGRIRRRGRRRRKALVLFAGRVTWQKGPAFFLEAAALVARENRRARFAMAGSGDLLPAAIARAQALGLRGRVLFTGFLPPEALSRLYADADVFVLSSVSEPFGLAALEALSHGTPAIVSRRAGVAEVVRNVLPVEFGDARDLADKILAVLAVPRAARAFGAQGRREVRRLTWRDAAEKCLGIYEEVCALTPRRTGTTTPSTFRSGSPEA